MDFKVGDVVIVKLHPIETPEKVEFREGRILEPGENTSTEHLKDPSKYRLVNIRLDGKRGKEPLMYKSHVGWVPIEDISKPTEKEKETDE